MYNKIISAMIITVFFFIPTQVFAVDYQITDVEINAYLQDDGDVSVQEKHTYQFSDEFGGIIRELIPKEGTEIVQLEAYEKDQPLTIESNETEHRIHRAGKDETVTIDLFYEIKNGVDVYADVAEFYWPFFDRSNESTYENMMIHVFPPEPATGVIAFGYDEAFQKEDILEEGHVQFQLGEVPSNRNGDIRVAYDAKLFGAAAVTSNKPMQAAIEAAKQQLLDEEIASAKRKESLASIGVTLVTLLGLLLLFLLVRAWILAKAKRAALKRELTNDVVIPKQTISLPTTILYMNYHQLLPEAIAAALLDLVRKGHVTKLENDRFRVVNRNGLFEHEHILVEWLFDEIGAKAEFSFDDLSVYLKNKKNHEKYQHQKSKWQNAVKAELKEAHLYENKVKYRLTIGLVSFILVPFAILFAVNDLIGLSLSSIGVFLGLFLFAIFYHPKTWKGAKLTLEWRKFKQQFPNILQSTWHNLSEDDKMRAFIYGLGMNDERLKKKNQSLVNAFKKPINGHQSSTTYGFDLTWIIIAAAATSNFTSAEKTTGATSSSSGGSFGGGGSGAGGGGGGSGAF
ncbi:DUF2207 domain-containing protein [Halalkalibacter kiskunsagensis]|uniref:DUF2207 domain-containing protein n=1 Tax=Halalkalibacter kiskunsagensis TaxID=1548599 RepID=A0ABV6KD64_9BACI